MSETSESIMDGFKHLVIEHGDPVGIDTSICVDWKQTHSDCKGCSMSLGCSKFIALMGISMATIMYQPKSFDDFESMNEKIQAKLDLVLASKDVEEIQKVRW